MAGKPGNIAEDLLDHSVREPAETYVSGNHSSDQVYINPFDDWVFKRIFTAEAHKELIMAFLNEVLQGRRQIQSNAYIKNEYPAEI